MSASAHLQDAVEPDGFDISVITAGQPTRTVSVAVGSTLGDLAELVGAGGRAGATALVGTGALVDEGYVLTAADDRVSFVQRLAGAGHGVWASTP